MSNLMGSRSDNGNAVARSEISALLPAVHEINPTNTVNVELDPRQTHLVSASVQSWYDNEHYKRILREASSVISAAAEDMDRRNNNMSSIRQLVKKEKKRLEEKLQDILFGKEGFGPRLLAAAPEDHREVTFDLIRKHSAAPRDYYVTMTAAALLNAGCEESAVTTILALLDDPSLYIFGAAATWEVDASLHYAARNGHKRLLQLLLRLRGTDVNTWWDLTLGAAIHLAAEHDHGDVMQVLLDSPGIDVDRPCYRSDKECTDSQDFRNLCFRPCDSVTHWTVLATPIRIAAANGSLNALKAMLQHPAMARVVNDPFVTGEASCLCAFNRHKECLSLLEGLKRKPDGAGGMLSLMYEPVFHDLNEGCKHCFDDFIAEQKAKARLSLNISQEDEGMGEKSENGNQRSLEQMWADMQNGAKKVFEFLSEMRADELLKEEELEKDLKQSKKAKKKAKKAAKRAKGRKNDDDVTSACSSREASSRQQSLCQPRPCVSSSSACTAIGDAAHHRQQDDDPVTTGGSLTQHSQAAGDNADGKQQDPQLVETLLHALLPGSEASASSMMSGNVVSSSKNAANEAETRESQTIPVPKSLAERLGLKVPVPVFAPSTPIRNGSRSS